jgi:methionyl-tRNA formyltransferase
MKIGFFGGGPVALTVLARILAEPRWQVVFIHPRAEDDEPLIGLAEENGIPVMKERNINSAAALAYIRGRRADLLLSINTKQIFKSELLSIPPLGAVNLHGGLLPRQRGGGGPMWP